MFTKTHKFALKSPGLQFVFEGEISAAIFSLAGKLHFADSDKIWTN